MHRLLVEVLFLLSYAYIVVPTPLLDGQIPEINDQFENITTIIKPVTSNITAIVDDLYKYQNSNIIKDGINRRLDKRVEAVEDKPPRNKRAHSVVTNILQVVLIQIRKLLAIPRIQNVLHNIGTCIVNGVMELVSFYLPAPLIPLITSIAGKIIPFEPVVTLRRRIPVTSYRRAFKTAVDGFLNTFNDYKFENYDDPYMTRRFNRRFMNDDAKDGDKNDLN